MTGTAPVKDLRQDKRKTVFPPGVTIHIEGYVDPIEGHLRINLTKCGRVAVPGTYLTSPETHKHATCEACKTAK